MEVTQGTSETTCRKYLIPIDAGPDTKRAAKFYAERLRRDNDMVFFVHVVEPTYHSPAVSLTMDNPTAMAGEMTKQMQEKLDNAKVLGQRYMAWAKENGIKSKAYVHVDGKPGHAILKASTDNKVDHIVIGSPGLNALGRVLLGSISDYIIHHSQIPVTLIPCPENEKTAKGVRRFSLY